jgi:chromosome partitioning protein
MMSRVIAVANHKGGTGKTSTTWALGAAMAVRGLHILMIDLDPQASLTLATGVRQPERTVWTAMEDVINTGDAPELRDMIVHLDPDGLDLLPSSLALSAADLALLNTERREYVLNEMLAPLAGAYDAILLDCPPALNLLVINALTAAQEVVIPVQPDYLAVGGLSLFLQTIARVKSRKLNPGLRIAGLVLTMTDARTAHDRSYAPQLHEVAAAQGFPLLGEIPRATAIRDAAAAAVPPTLHSPRHPSAQAYAALADRLIADWGLDAPAHTEEMGEREVARG